MGNRGLLTEDKQLFNWRRGDLWDIPGKYNKTWLR